MLNLKAPRCANTAGVVVLFHPDGYIIKRLQKVLSQVALLVVVSNDGLGRERLKNLDPERFIYIEHDGNIGLAAALNQGIMCAKSKGFMWCLLLDQDTEIYSDLIKGLSETFLACPSPNLVGILAPNYISPAGNKLAYPDKPIWQELVISVTSGSLVAISAVHQVGGMKESFFIEGIDIEFCLRIRRAGLQIIGSGRSLMIHGAGESEERNFFGRVVLVGHHSPWRYFMQFRNLTWIMWRYKSQEPKWVSGALVSMFKRFCLVLLFERQPIRKALAMIHGVCSGIIQLCLIKSNQYSKEDMTSQDWN